MRKETDYIITTLRSVLEGSPWYGTSVMKILHEVDEATIYKKPGENSHSLVELLYHMNTWTEFVLKRLERDEEDMAAFEKLDWREINSAEHDWEKGVSQFKVTNDLIIELLQSKENDEFLSEKVDYREYNFRFLLNGMIQHHIYHAGQVAYVKKMLS